MKNYIFEYKPVQVPKVAYCIVLFIISCSWQSLARDYVDHQLVGNTLKISTDDAKIEINALKPSVFEVLYQPVGIKQLPSFAIDKPSIASGEHSIKLTVVDSAKQLTLSSHLLDRKSVV